MVHTLSLPQPKLFFLKAVFLFCILMISAGIQAQNCPNQITVESGLQQFPCADVNVSTEGYTLITSVDPCPGGSPYYIQEGSWIYAFSEPVGGVTFNFTSFDFQLVQGGPPIYEVVTLEINGVPFPFPNAGSASSCPFAVPLIVDGSGGLRSTGGLGPGSCERLNITTPISTIKVTNTYYNGDALGILFDIAFCCPPCVVKAGLIPSAPLNLCPEEVATVPPAAPNVLPAGTMLQYILFSDPGDTLGSIVSISNTPNFTFDPAAMQEGVTYYIAAIAGKELNGNVDLSDRCLDVSNAAVPVTWRPKPSVSFSSDKTDVCKGNCVDVKVELSGEPPFTLTYDNTYTGIQTKIYTNHFGILTFCIPPNTPEQKFNIQAIKLTDKFCVCE
ncbi:MAG: hypothetical protein ACKVT2_16240 [Saprospiraceae bacterium]